MSQNKKKNPALGADYSEKMKTRYAEKVKPSAMVYSKADRRQNQVVEFSDEPTEGTMQENTELHLGQCLCGAVKFQIKGEIRQVIVCHCGQCSHTHGHFGAYSSSKKSQLEMLEDKGLKWFQSSDFARRGFCQECGASIFFDRMEGESISFSAGMLENPTGLKIIGHIFVDDKPDYYEINDDLPQFEQTAAGQLEGDYSNS